MMTPLGGKELVYAFPFRGGLIRISTKLQQQLCPGGQAKMLSHLGSDVCLVLWRCGLVCHLVGYDVGVIEMLLMMSGDVESNPGPGEWWV